MKRVRPLAAPQRRAWAKTIVLGMALVTLSGGVFVSFGNEAARAQSATVLQFEFTGGSQQFVVPEGVCELTVDAFGAAGSEGKGDPSQAPGGLGGRALATVPVISGEALHVYVGGQGAVRAGGFNGGGAGGDGSDGDGDAGGGGGASDVRNEPLGLDDRIVVAGGGGGGGADSPSGSGGAGGGLTGQDGAASQWGTPPGKGGTQTAGGAAPAADPSATAGEFGQGGEGGVGATGDDAGGGGGGGWYGGGGGAGELSDPGTADGAGGGGGSGFGPAGTVFETGVRAGDGYVEISYTADEECGTVEFDWTMPERFGFDRDGDGMVDYYPPSGNLVIEPDGWRVDFTHGDPADCDDELSRDWRIDGDSIDPADPNALVYDPSSCAFSYRFPKEDTYQVELVVYDADQNRIGSVTHEVIVQDWLIVSVGDSVASGEGVPDQPLSPTLSQAQWQDERCHRSANAGTAEAARNLENADPKTSVTFVHLACSGAEIVKGLIQSYRGIVPGAGGPMPKPQIEHINALVKEREIDAILISIGANDIEFRTLVEKCAFWGDCHLNQARRLFDQKIVLLPTKFEALQALMTGPAGVPDVPAERVYIAEYFDPTRFDDSSVCGRKASEELPATEEVLYDHPITLAGLGVSQAEAEWASQLMLPTLNQVVQNAAGAAGWRYVGGIRNNFLANGYCATVPYVVTWSGSRDDQGDTNGTLHPNVLGHFVYATQIRDALGSDFYANGDLSKPRKPVS